ncbi:zinc-ribbon-domain-containing protein [Microdochium trichocladiopsis]|uniref:Zinc-ribbon-domain-containing protein n=1 Tax=Microdochium trichocladiopsis TaxID=1682393 RepID=A0A9P9C030_9PEZI|nr:zinc-ribbon-domain-containing protein [Microdochium trichocladiopsis]KAH7040724.1 zinc-ribbon-domain-containing protein [Microdochium trichocladiopsis]
MTVEETEEDVQHVSEAPTTSRSPRAPKPIPEDDGMGLLRRRILAIQAQDLPANEKAQLMHRLFIEKYAKAQISNNARSELLAAVERPTTSTDGSSWQQRITGGSLDSLKFWQNVLGESSTQEEFTLTEDDTRPTYVPAGPDDDPSDRPLGCQHYMRNVKLQCSTCERWYTCRFCHNEAEDHELIRKETKNMLCMYCGTAQKAGEVCVACGVSAARYYCSVCKLWNNDPDKNVYHCDDCGICRVGRGIGKDFFHCKRCVACIAISTVHDHKCFERATDCDCPICGEYMFTSPKPVVFMKCGHSIHRNCFDDYMHTSYKCPICNKSVVNMEIQFRNLDLAIAAQPMPPELRDTQAVVLCNDCSAKSSVQYHWLGLKCGVCQSYNTAQLQITGSTDTSTPAPAAMQTPATTSLNTAVHNVTFADAPAASPVEIPNSRETLRRRRHSSSYTGPPVPETDTDRRVQNRLARSESPTAFAARHLGRAHPMDIEEEDEEDMLGLWSRIPRSITSDDEAGDQEAPDDTDEESEEETDDDDENLDDEDDDDEDEDEGTRLGFFMPGHR